MKLAIETTVAIFISGCAMLPISDAGVGDLDVEGVVLDAATETPIAGARISVAQSPSGGVDTNSTVLSDAQGKFRIAVSGPASWSVGVGVGGYPPLPTPGIYRTCDRHFFVVQKEGYREFLLDVPEFCSKWKPPWIRPLRYSVRLEK